MEEELILNLINQVNELKVAVDSQGTKWWHTLLTAVVAFLAALVPNAIMEWSRRRHESRILRSALAAEMFAISQIIRKRGYIDTMKQCAEHGDIVEFGINVPADYARVYRSSVTKLGLLNPKEAASIIYCYNLLESVIQDVIPGGVLASGMGGREAFLQDIEFLETVLHLTDEFVEIHGTNLL